MFIFIPCDSLRNKTNNMMDTKRKEIIKKIQESAKTNPEFRKILVERAKEALKL